jgi:branched-subunit amino acid ABC-type transport system permease component
VDPLWKILTDNWDIILMYPVLFAAAVFIGWLAGWTIIRLVYNQRLAHQADMITNLRAVLEEKLPASFLPPIKQSRRMNGTSAKMKYKS